MSQVLNALQQSVLESFFRSPFSAGFVLTGGTALAEYYLHHRISEDLDFFTSDPQALEVARARMDEIAESTGATARPIRALQTLHQVVLERDDQSVKVDLAYDPGPWFGEPLSQQGVRVDAVENIGPNKLLALFGRAASRDYVDVYFLVQELGQDFDKMVGDAKHKDPGLQEFYLAWWLRQQTPKLENWPTMLKSLDVDKLKRYFLAQAETLMAAAAPDKP